eukprot:EG_transcript_43366
MHLCCSVSAISPVLSIERPAFFLRSVARMGSTAGLTCLRRARHCSAPGYQGGPLQRGHPEGGQRQRHPARRHRPELRQHRGPQQPGVRNGAPGGEPQIP